MTQGRKLTIEKRLEALEERLQALGSQPARQGGYMTSAGLTMPAPPPPKHRGVIVESVPNPTLSRIEELGTRVS